MAQMNPNKNSRPFAFIRGNPTRPPAILLIGATCLGLCAFGDNKKIVVIAHRGEHLHHPENTIPACQAAIDAGADFIEVDVRTTADGKLVLMHDSTIDRRTKGNGAVKDLTFEQIRALDAGVKFGPQFAGTSVPTFEEALVLARGKIGVYVDTKQASARDLIAAIEKHHMEDHVVIYGGLEVLKEIARLRPRIKVMPEAVSVSFARSLVEQLRPRVIAFDARDFQDDIVAVAKQGKADIYVDRLGPADNPSAWQNAIDRGATGIQTDKPAELVQYLKSKGYR
jgi:glycerophosphoryl diester phosphodiesterase